MSLITEMFNVFAALGSGDWWTMRPALAADGAWLAGFVVALVGGLLVMVIYNLFPIIDRHLERGVTVWTYLAMAGIIFFSVLHRFGQTLEIPWAVNTPLVAWSATIPPLFFMVMAWFGCSYNVRLRTHLSFSEFRSAMPRWAQMACLTLDALLWFAFAVMIIVTSSRIFVSSGANFRIVSGTDDTMLWWFQVTVPIAFILMAGRVFQNWFDDWRNFRSGEPLIKQAVLGEGETA